MKKNLYYLSVFFFLLIITGWEYNPLSSAVPVPHKDNNTSEIHLYMPGDQTIVYGGTTILIPYVYGGTAPFTFLWSNGNTNRILEVAPDTTTTYTLLVTDASGATKSGSTTVTVIEGAKPFIRIPDIQTCDDTISIPILAGNWVEVTSISLTLRFNPQNMTYLGWKNLYPTIAYSNFTINVLENAVFIAGLCITTPLTIQNDTLLEMLFAVNPSVTEFAWDTSARWNCEMTNLHNYRIPFDFIGGTIEAGNCSTLQGTVSYDNMEATPMQGCTVEISGPGGQTRTLLTDAQGHYDAGELVPGNYTIRTKCTGPWGGINAMDALKVLQQFVHGNVLSGLKLKAADADASGFVNTSDALKIARRFIGQINTFPSGDWVIPVENITVFINEAITYDIKVICYGDTDGSFVP